LGFDKQGDKQEQQDMAYLSTRPFGSVEHPMVILELLLVLLSHHPQDRCYGSLSWYQNGSYEQHFGPLPYSFTKYSFKVAQHAYNLFRQIHFLSSFLDNRLREDYSAFPFLSSQWIKPVVFCFTFYFTFFRIYLLPCRDEILQQETMDKTIAPTDTPQQKASACVIEELWRSPWEGMGAPEQQTNEVVPPGGESTHCHADE
jgi:hypothetical protein